MRILVVADIHGNRAALDAVREPFDACLCLGDIVDYGPEPGQCVEWVREHATHCVRGNHDHGVAQDVEVQGVAGFRYLTAVTRPLSVAALTPDQRRFLADLPTSQMFALGGKRFLMVHATPRDPMDEYARADPAFWEPLVAGLGVDYLLAGHTHQPHLVPLDHRVGRPRHAPRHLPRRRVPREVGRRQGQRPCQRQQQRQAARLTPRYQYICDVGLMTSSGTDTRGGSVATNSTASATSSGFRIVARCSSVIGLGRATRIGVSISPG